MQTGNDGPELIELDPGGTPVDELIPVELDDFFLCFGMIFHTGVNERLLDMMEDDSSCSWRFSKLRADLGHDL